MSIKTFIEARSVVMRRRDVDKRRKGAKQCVATRVAAVGNSRYTYISQYQYIIHIGLILRKTLNKYNHTIQSLSILYECKNGECAF